MLLAVVCGLPGTGKSGLAEALGRELGIPVFAKDWLEAALLRAGLGPPGGESRTGFAAYELLTTLAARQLDLGQSAVLDSVATFERLRAEWRALALARGADWRVIECVCSDPALHLNRLTGRRRGIPGWAELTWADVERVRARYEAWSEPRLVLDAVDPSEANLRRALAYLR